MKLKEYTPATHARVRPNKARIGINKSGYFVLSKRLMEVMKLSEGDEVIMLQDAEAPTDWYITKVKDEGFSVRKYGANGVFASVAIRTEFMAAIERDEPSGVVMVGEEPTEQGGRKLFPIITSSFKYRVNKRRGS